jgi:hypothetical protein
MLSNVEGACLLKIKYNNILFDFPTAQHSVAQRVNNIFTTIAYKMENSVYPQ